MPALPISTVRQNLFGLVQQVNDDHDPLTVVTKAGENAVLVAESDWNSLMETLYVLQTHGGAQLLKSAQDARDGRTEAHVLIDDDEEVPDGWLPGSETPLRACVEKLPLLKSLLAVRGEGVTEERLLEELRHELDVAWRVEMYLVHHDEPSRGSAAAPTTEHARPRKTRRA
jgi:antitoxin YefM